MSLVMNSNIEMVPISNDAAKTAEVRQRMVRGPNSTHPDRDGLVLAQSGKKQVLKRRFGLLSMTSLALTNTNSWEAIVSVLSIGLLNGGQAGVIYGCILGWLGTLSVFICMGELTSMAPTVGGQYHWVSSLFPHPFKVPLSYVTGWIMVATWSIGPAGASYVAGTMLTELISFLYPAYTPQPYQSTLVSWAMLAVCILLNTVFGALLPAIELTFLIIHILGFFAILIPLATLGPNPASSAKELFTTFNNGGGWFSPGLSFFVGLQGSATAFIGDDCAIHMAEEVEKADMNVSRAMNTSIAINGVLSTIMAILILYVAAPLDVLATGSQYPLIDIIFKVTQSEGATAALTSIIIFTMFSSSCSSVAAGSRMMWGFSRDKGLPFSKHLFKVDKKYALPITSILTVTIVAALLLLIQIGSAVAFTVFQSLFVEGCFASYLIVLCPLLYHRVKGNILEPLTWADGDETPPTLRWGPWRLKGIYGTLNNLIAVCYLLLVGFFSFWPPLKDVDAETMNYSCLILGAVAVLSIIYYFIWARKTYHGPIKEISAAEFAQAGLSQSLNDHTRDM